MKRELDKRIIELLKSRGYETRDQIDAFLEPTLSLLNNPFDLTGMSEAKERIERAVAKKEKVVIYGDYDCDGISACVILYNYFLSRGIKCDVYIPDRFDDGYGLSPNMTKEVLSNSKPDLIITVDLGVTAVQEVEEIKRAGADIIVTDHHEPGETLPNCIVIDPKIEGQKYPFNGLCGAGVALKIVEALSGKKEAEKYFDICALATIGDIVPLTDENRLIAKAGIEKINNGQCIKSIKYMLSELGLKKVTSTDITFKIVPRINASGRMSKGKKVFDFLIEENPSKLKELFASITSDNELRLNSISEGAEILEKQMKKEKLYQDSIILLRGDFHQGVLGILASRICHDYNRPAIIFTKTLEGTLKGSGRSVDGVDLHSALENCTDLLKRFGGHKMAIGVELEEQNFEALKERLSKEVLKQVSLRDFLIKEEYDIQITEDDISEDFISQLNLLEPFGCKNERPVLMLEVESLRVTQMKDASYRHFKLSTKKGKSIVAFSADKHIDALKSPAKKHLIIDLENNEFKGKIYPQAVLKNVFLKDISLKSDGTKEAVVSLCNKYFALKNKEKQNTNFYELFEMEKTLQNLAGNGFGTLVVVDSHKQAERIKKMNIKGYTLSHYIPKNGQNTLLISSRGVICPEDASGYRNIVFTRQIFAREKEGFAKHLKVFCPKNINRAELELDGSREANIFFYTIVKKCAPKIRANNLFEWLEKAKSMEGAVSVVGLCFALLSFWELGFVKINFDDFSIDLVENPPKRELSSSKFMTTLAETKKL